jgi:hypothetical protein
MRHIILTAIAAVMLTAGLVAESSAPVADRFTFKVPSWTPNATFGADWLELVINQWSSEADRQSIVDTLKNDGVDKLDDAISREHAVGYLHWPGGLDYNVRFAHRVPTADGGEDIIVGIDRPFSLWWNTGTTPGAPADAVVLQLRLNKDGHGEGRLVKKVNVNPTAKTITFDDFPSAAVIVTDVQRARSSSSLVASDSSK